LLLLLKNVNDFDDIYSDALARFPEEEKKIKIKCQLFFKNPLLFQNDKYIYEGLLMIVGLSVYGAGTIFQEIKQQFEEKKLID